MPAKTYTYHNLGFMRSPLSGYVESFLGNRNSGVPPQPVFSGVKYATSPWGFQYRQYAHPDSTYDVVYLTKTTVTTNKANGATQTVVSQWNRFFTGNIQFDRAVIKSTTYSPSAALWGSAGGTNNSDSNHTPTSPTTAIFFPSNSANYSGFATLSDPYPLSDEIARVRAKVEEDPFPSYQVGATPNNYAVLGDEYRWNGESPQTPNTGVWRVTKGGVFFDTRRPFLASFVGIQKTASLINGVTVYYYVVYAQKTGVSLPTPTANSLNFRKFCTSEWTFNGMSTDSSAFSPHRNCQTFDFPTRSGPVNYVIDLPDEDPAIATTSHFVTNNTPGEGHYCITARELYFPGYTGPMVCSGNLPFVPAPGPCCVLT
jgi:hypothetical protein